MGMFEFGIWMVFGLSVMSCEEGSGEAQAIWACVRAWQGQCGGFPGRGFTFYERWIAMSNTRSSQSDLQSMLPWTAVGPAVL